MAISTDVLNSVNGTSSSGGSTSGSKNDTSAQAVQDRFLKLLVAQLNNQDPMNPLDNAQMTSQMAQINTVTGIETLNQTVSTMLSQMSAMQALQGTGLVGREVLVPGSGLSVSGGVARGGFDLSTAADSVQVEIRSASGQLLDTLDLGTQAAGRHTFEWDATGYADGAALQFKVVPTAGGVAVTSTALQRAKVEGVGTESNALTLQLASGASVSYDNVRAIY